MRVSIYENDIGYTDQPHRYRIYFNGVELKYVLTADEEKRFLVMARLNNNGEFSLDENCKVITETMYGDVYIKDVSIDNEIF